MVRLGLHERVINSIRDKHRNYYDLIRTIAIIVPQNTALSFKIEETLDCMEQDTGETYHAVYFAHLLEIMDRLYDCRDDNCPWWVKVCLLILNGGSEIGYTVFESLDESFLLKQSV